MALDDILTQVPIDDIAEKLGVSRDEAKVAFRLSPSLAEYFRNADLNGDGYLTQQEIRTVADRRRAERQERRKREALQKQQAQAAALGRDSATAAPDAQR